MTDPNESITLTWEELERELKTMLHMIYGKALPEDIAELADAATTAMFTNAKAREEGDKEEAFSKAVRDIPGPSLSQSADTHRGELTT